MRSSAIYRNKDIPVMVDAVIHKPLSLKPALRHTWHETTTTGGWKSFSTVPGYLLVQPFTFGREKRMCCFQLNWATSGQETTRKTPQVLWPFFPSPALLFAIGPRDQAEARANCAHCECLMGVDEGGTKYEPLT